MTTEFKQGAAGATGPAGTDAPSDPYAPFMERMVELAQLQARAAREAMQTFERQAASGAVWPGILTPPGRNLTAPELQCLYSLCRISLTTAVALSKTAAADHASGPAPTPLSPGAIAAGMGPYPGGPYGGATWNPAGMMGEGLANPFAASFAPAATADTASRSYADGCARFFNEVARHCRSSAIGDIIGRLTLALAEAQRHECTYFDDAADELKALEALWAQGSHDELAGKIGEYFDRRSAAAAEIAALLTTKPEPVAGAMPWPPYSGFGGIAQPAPGGDDHARPVIGLASSRDKSPDDYDRVPDFLAAVTKDQVFHQPAVTPASCDAGKPPEQPRAKPSGRCTSGRDRSCRCAPASPSSRSQHRGGPRLPVTTRGPAKSCKRFTKTPSGCAVLAATGSPLNPPSPTPRHGAAARSPDGS